MLSMFKISYEDFKGDVAVNFESVCVREHEFDIVLTDRVPSERFNYAFNDLAKYSVRKNGNDVCCFDIYEPITEDQAEVLPICDQNDAVFGVLLDLENTFSLLDMSVLKAVIEFVRETYGTFSMAPVIGQEAEFISCISDDDTVSDCEWADRGFGVFTFYGRTDGDLVQPWREIVPESESGLRPMDKQEFISHMVNGNCVQNDETSVYVYCADLEFNSSVKIVDVLGYDFFDKWMHMVDRFGNLDDGCDGFLPSHMVDDDPDNIAWDHFYCDYLIQYGM